MPDYIVMNTLTPHNFPPDNTSVLIVGGGPCGLMLANELGRRNIRTVLVNDKPTTAVNPQANATQARTMEHFRRLGFADEIRSQGLPADFPTDIAYFTRYAHYELARFSLPSASQAKDNVRHLSGSWSAAELPHRVSQKFVETTLYQHAQKFSSNSLHFGWRLLEYQESKGHVDAYIQRVSDGEKHVVRGAYLVGADGPRSTVREQLGFRYTGETGVVRDFMGGRMYAIYVRCPDFYRVVPHAPAWMSVSFNNERRAFMAAVDGKGEFAFHTQLRPHEAEDAVTDADAVAMFRAAVGADVDVEILSRGAWTAGHSLVAEHFQQGRIFIGGDAAHLFTPTGGLGYNTAVEDAVNLGWKLSAVLKGQAPESLLQSYEVERRPLAERNTQYAKGFADSIGNFRPVSEIEADSAPGARARDAAGEYLARHGRTEFNIPGVTFGGRYDESPVIINDGTPPPPDCANEYVPTAKPGGRPPHAWLASGLSLYDTFDTEWSLLALNATPSDIHPFITAAKAMCLDLKVVQPEAINKLLPLYGAHLTLIRPDHIVAWQGNDGTEASRVLARVIGTLDGKAKLNPDINKEAI